MARTKGTLQLSSNIEPNMNAPLDGRDVVATLADLTASGSFPYFYEGMKVYVKSEQKTYQLKGNDPTISANWGEMGGGQSIQLDTMPTASVDFADKIVQYVGSTTNTYKNGYFYKCVEDSSTTPSTYSWINIKVETASNEWGYLYNNAFYEDSLHTVLIASSTDVLYIDRSSRKLYEFDGTDFIEVSESDSALVYQPGGSYAFANLPANIADNLGKVYNVTDEFTTTSDFVEGAGEEYPANTDVAVINAGTPQSPVYKYNIFLGSLAGYQKKFQFMSMPTASADTVDKIIQFIGTTTSSYTQGYFYIGTTDGTNYSWEPISVQGTPETLTTTDMDDIKASFTGMNRGAPLRMMNYSLDEQVIGTWIDGKKIYQKTITITISAPTDGSPNTTNYDASGLSINQLLSYKGVIEGSDFVRCIPDIFGNIPAHYVEIYYAKLTSNICLVTTRSSMDGLNATITLQYTKTT